MGTDRDERLAPAQGRLGGILVQRGGLTAGRLAAALAVQAETGDRLGAVLVAGGDVTEVALSEALADQLRIPLIDLEGLEPSEQAAALVPEGLQRRRRCLPLECDDRALYVAVTDPLDNETYGALRELTDLEIRVHMAVPSQIAAALRELHRASQLRSARSGLLAVAPEHSANRVFSAGQRLFGLLVVAALIAAALISAPTTLAALCVALAALHLGPLGYLLGSLWGPRSAHRGPASARLGAESADAGGGGGEDRSAPPYSVILPLVERTDGLSGLLEALDALDYPRARLELVALLRPGDADSAAAIARSGLGPVSSVVELSDGRPGSVAVACNYGLQQARGRFAVIYDAADRPEPEQLRRAIATFEASAPGTVPCAQATVLADGPRSAATSRAARELALWSRAFSAAAPRPTSIAPLGPGSIHLDREAALAAGGFDTFNAIAETELGIRLARAGHPAAPIDSRTLRSGEGGSVGWLADRARLVRGAMQTYLVEMRAPGELLASLGPRGWLAVQCLLGSVGLALAGPPLAAVAVLWVLGATGAVDSVGLPAAAGCAAAIALVLSLLFVAVAEIAGERAAGGSAWGRRLLGSPLRLLAVWAASWRGLAHLLRRPFRP